MVQALLSILEKDWRLYVDTLIHSVVGWSEGDYAQWWSDFVFRSTTPEAVKAAWEASFEFDVTAILADVQAPTLVIHPSHIGWANIDDAKSIAAGIPNARMVVLEGAPGVLWFDDSGPVMKAIEDFLDEGPETRSMRPEHTQASGSFRTVLFTDLVGHTEMMQRLGDAKGRDVLREHERITREVLKANGGTEVKTMGDGFLASFGSVTKAVECAIALQRAFADRNRGVGARRPFRQDGVATGDDGSQPRSDSVDANASPLRASVEPLSVRVGLNAGEPIEEDGDLFGATVILASRIAAKAASGEILVADTVRGLCSGKGFLFADRGEFVAKGIEDPVRISEVSWRS